MRTAIFLLLLVAAIASIGSFAPQQDNATAANINTFLLQHERLVTLASLFGLNLTQVYVSPLLIVALGSIYIALSACVYRRGRALLKRIGRGTDKTPQFWGEAGSWCFHASFFLLLIAVVWGKATGFQGLMAVTEGERAAEVPARFDTLQQGLLFSGQHAGYQVLLNSFSAPLTTRGIAADYVSNLTVENNGRSVETQDVRVNQPLIYDGVSWYQQDYGWAPVLVVRNPAGQEVFSSPVQFFGSNKSVETGVLKVPDFGYTIPGATKSAQIGGKMAVFPDARTIPQVNADGSIDPSQTNYGPGGVLPNNPVVQLQLYVGDLGLGSGQPQNVNDLDTSKMQPYFADAHPVPVALGETVPFALPGAGGQSATFTISFTQLRHYSLFLVKKDAGVTFVYVTFVMAMLGLLAKLYLRPILEARRRGKGTSAIEVELEVSGKPRDFTRV